MTDKVIVTCALTGGLANRDQCPGVPSTPAEIAEEARRAYESRAAKVKPELECFDVGHTNSVGPLIDKGLLEPPLQFSFIMGVLGGIRATAENLAVQSREAPPGSTWEVIGVSHEQWRMVGAALALGGNVRVGLEDNFYLDTEGKETAKSNGALAAKAVRMARDMR